MKNRINLTKQPPFKEKEQHDKHLGQEKAGVLIGAGEQRCFLGNHLDAMVASEPMASPVMPEVTEQKFSQSTLRYPNT